MIIHNDFVEFNETAEKIDQRLYFTNLYIKRGDKHETPRNERGKIIINDTDDERYFGGELVHEAGHTVFDPVTPKNCVTYVYKISNELYVDMQTASFLSNIASDLIIAWKIKDDPLLNEYRKHSVEVMYKKFYKDTDAVRKELFGLYKKIHGCRFKARSNLYKTISSILNSPYTKEWKHIEIAKAFYELMLKKNVKPEGDKVIVEPFLIDENEARKVAQQLIEESNNVVEAKKKIEILMKITDNPEELKKMEYMMHRRFFEAKARKVQMSVVFPKERTQQGVKVGSKRWRPEYGWKAIDVKRTVFKYGHSIPLITTQSPRIMNRFISSIENDKPCDLVVSIDTSGSTGNPNAYMNCVADFEVVMFYALVNLAKKLNQKIGLTLWSDDIEYTTLPEMYDWRKSEELKRAILLNWTGWGTRILYALRQAEQNPDKLFFVFTDGEVNHDELIDVDNVMFFLIKPRDHDYKEFVERYGSGRVIKINSLESIPKVTVQQYVKLFMK